MRKGLAETYKMIHEKTKISAELFKKHRFEKAKSIRLGNGIKSYGTPYSRPIQQTTTVILLNYNHQKYAFNYLLFTSRLCIF